MEAGCAGLTEMWKRLCPAPSAALALKVISVSVWPFVCSSYAAHSYSQHAHHMRITAIVNMRIIAQPTCASQLPQAAMHTQHQLSYQKVARFCHLQLDRDFACIPDTPEVRREGRAVAAYQ